MYLHEYVERRLRELEVSWEACPIKSTYVITQVLEFFQVNTEDDIIDADLKLQVAEAVLFEALKEDVTQPYPEFETEIQEEVAGNIRPMYEFIPREALDPEERRLVEESEWQSPPA